MVRLLIEGRALNKSVFKVIAAIPPKLNEESGLTSIKPEVLLNVPLIPNRTPTFISPAKSKQLFTLTFERMSRHAIFMG